MNSTCIQLIFLFCTATAQDYFPLQVGNSWTYCSIIDTTYKRTYQVTDSISIRGQNYFLYGSVRTVDRDTIRQDPHGNILKMINGAEHLWFDFTKDSGAVYSCPAYDKYIYTIEVAKPFIVKTWCGTFANCICFDTYIQQAVDSNTSYTFAPGVGLIQQYGAKGSDRLYSALINGISVKVVEEKKSEPLIFTLWQNYPNPFNTNTTIVYALPADGFVKLTILDILDREVAQIVNTYQKAGEHRIIFAGKELTNGLYFLSLRQEKYSTFKKCLVLK